MVTGRVTSPPSEYSAAAIRCIAARGYEATTAEDLAEAIGVSRSTFFRRFGSKDDVVFAEHDHALSQLDDFLASTNAPPADALVQGASDVLRHLIRDPEAARIRFELVRSTPPLRDRELVITHRYERVFARHLRDNLPVGTPAWVAGAIASSTVAVHNATLRGWLVGEIDDATHHAARDLKHLLCLYDRWLSPDRPAERSRVLVAVYETESSPESVYEALAEQLGREG